MGIGCRILFVDEDESLQRISMVRLDRLVRFDPSESLRRYANKRVRCTKVFLEVAGRQVLAIRNIDYFILPFDAKGQINKKEWENGMRLGMELLPPLLSEERSKQVINARHRFAKRRYEHEFKWKPYRKVEEAIVSAVFESTVTKL